MAKLTWKRQADGSYCAIGRTGAYVIFRQKPWHPYLLKVDNEVQRVSDLEPLKEPITFWYLCHAKEQAQGLEIDRIVFSTHTLKGEQNHTLVGTLIQPDAAQIGAGVREYNKHPDLRAAEGAQDVWTTDSTYDAASRPMLVALVRFALEIAEWGGIYPRWASNEDVIAAGTALLSVMQTIADLRAEANRLGDARYTNQDHRASVLRLWESLVAGMKEQSIFNGHESKFQYSWASKLLHWLLPDSVPIYDSRVLKALDIRGTGSKAFERIIEMQYNIAWRIRGSESEIVGDIPAQTLLRSIDKFLFQASVEAGRTRQQNFLRAWPVVGPGNDSSSPARNEA